MQVVYITEHIKHFTRVFISILTPVHKSCLHFLKYKTNNLKKTDTFNKSKMKSSIVLYILYQYTNIFYTNKYCSLEICLTDDFVK